jgi:hypothetical protein
MWPVVWSPQSYSLQQLLQNYNSQLTHISHKQNTENIPNGATVLLVQKVPYILANPD